MEPEKIQVLESEIAQLKAKISLLEELLKYRQSIPCALPHYYPVYQQHPQTLPQYPQYPTITIC